MRAAEATNKSPVDEAEDVPPDDKRGDSSDDGLRTRIAALEAENAELRQMIQDLYARLDAADPLPAKPGRWRRTRGRLDSSCCGA